jgi:hypothetical protein
MKNVILFFLMVSIGLVSCADKNKEEIEKLNKVLMEGHDALMPKTMGIADIKKDLLASAEKATEADKATALSISTNLQKAEDDMYEWMKNFGTAMNDVKDPAEKLKLYKELEVEVKKLTADTDSSIEAAKKFTAEHK